MKRSIYLALIVLVLSGLSACTSYDYYTAAINKTNLSSYHTFAWMPSVPVNKSDSGNKSNNKTNANVADVKIRDAATAALVAKGLKLSEQNPDLIVNYTTKVGIGSRTTYYTPYYGGFYGGWGWGGYGWGGYGWGGWGWGGYGWGRWGYGWGGYGWGWPYYGGIAYAEKEHYNEGTLIIDLIDTRSHKIVWRGFGVGEVHKNTQKTIEDLPKVVDGVINQLQLYPAVKKS